MAGNELNDVRSRLARLWRLTKADQKRDVSILIGLIVVGAVADVVTIGMVVPFLGLLAVAPDGSGASWVGPMLRTFGIRTPARQIIAIAILLCAAALAAGAVRILLTRKTRDFTAIFGHRLSVEVQRRMLLQPYAWHVRHNSSEQLAAIEKVEQVSMGVVLPLVQAIGGSILGTLVIAVLLKLAPGPTLLAVIIFGAIYFVLGARRAETPQALFCAPRRSVRATHPNCSGGTGRNPRSHP